MSALPTAPTGPTKSIPSQDDTHGRIHALLAAVATAVLEEQPGLTGFVDHRPQRDRSSGESWRGLETFCHVSALLASTGHPEGDSARQILTAVDIVATTRGMRRRSDSEAQGIRSATWIDARGDLLDVVVGVRVAIRAISAPFLPGSQLPPRSTSPSTPISPSRPISPLTQPPRLVR